MAWETRKGRGHYYTRSSKKNGRVVREYIGCGELAQMTAKLDTLKRQQKQAEREHERRTRAELQTLEELIAPLDEAAYYAVKSALEDAGYHQHKRGEWRKRRGERTEESQ